MELAKLQVPTTHQITPTRGGEKKGSSIVLERRQFKPSTAGREVYGVGTRNWPKHSLAEKCLTEFCRCLAYMC